MQFYALSLLELLDNIKTFNSDDRFLRLALLTARMAEAGDLFPELQTESDDAAPLPPQVDNNGNPVSTKYDFSNAVYDQKTVEEEIRWMLAEAAKANATFEQPFYNSKN